MLSTCTFYESGVGFEWGIACVSASVMLAHGGGIWACSHLQEKLKSPAA
ncbi:hypothetical protein [Pantoea rodasii]|nr:hypothetical protein [Pantoea rodasii]